MVNFSVVNVVATASLNQELDLYELWRLKGFFYDSDVYGGRVAYFKTENMEGIVSIFPSGKMISIGTKSEKRASEELRHAMRFLAEKGFIKEVKLRSRTQNIVVSADFKRHIDFEELANRVSGIYEPEHFPALILKIKEPYKASILIFTTGKVVIAGLKSSDQITPIVHMLEHIINVS
jgi:TATA-box binding protein (TBP) (component of TFIID and TFIIIB)